MLNGFLRKLKKSTCDKPFTIGDIYEELRARGIDWIPCTNDNGFTWLGDWIGFEGPRGVFYEIQIEIFSDRRLDTMGEVVRENTNDPLVYEIEDEMVVDFICWTRYDKEGSYDFDKTENAKITDKEAQNYYSNVLVPYYSKKIDEMGLAQEYNELLVEN